MSLLFISYRRVDSDFAHRLHEKLKQKLDTVIFIDINLREEHFTTAIETALYSADVLVSVVSPNTFAPQLINRPDDWIYKELTTALRHKTPITLALTAEMQFPLNVANLPPELHPMLQKQGVEFPRLFFDAAVDRLAEQIVSISKGAIGNKHTHPMPEEIKALRQRLQAIDKELIALEEGGNHKSRNDQQKVVHTQALITERQHILAQLRSL